VTAGERGYLVDTSSLSMFAPGRPAVPENITSWMTAQGNAGRLYLSVITVAEIEKGLRKLNRAGGTARSKALADWLQHLTDIYDDRLLPIDPATARIAGQIEDQAIAVGVNPGFADVLIAATARSHRLLLLTANVRHFRALGVDCVDPSEELPSEQ
jgi:toxin FitB